MKQAPFPQWIDDSLGEVLLRDDGRYDLIFTRQIRKPVDKVWAALTVPERIADWFTPVDLDLRVGGRYHIHFVEDGYSVEGEIVELEPLRRLAHTWPDPDPTRPPAIVSYDLEREGDGCCLTMANRGVPPEYASAVAGWHAFLEALPGAADGVPTRWSMERETELRGRYEHLLPQS
jgi:uncharacterized protein YndB with AHSA1/START domain